MIIVLKPHTSEENIHRVENLVKNLIYKTTFQTKT